MENQFFERLKAILDQAQELDNAAIYGSSTGETDIIRKVVLELDTAATPERPYEIGFPFRAFAVIDATDANVSANLKIGTQDSYMDSFPVKKGSELSLPFPCRKAFLDWSAQAGKTITILFFLRGQFSTNVLTVVNSGGVSITDGDAVEAIGVETVTTTAASLFAQDTTRKKMMIMNYGGTSIFLGGSASVTDDAGALPGIELAPGGSYAWENTAACFAIAKGVANGRIGLIKFT